MHLREKLYQVDRNTKNMNYANNALSRLFNYKYTTTNDNQLNILHWPSSSHPTRSAWYASSIIASWSCNPCTPSAKQSFLWSWLSCGRLAWFDHQNPFAYGHNVSYPLKYRTLNCKKILRLSGYLGEVWCFASFVLGNLVKGVLLALLSLAESLSFLWNVDHFYMNELISTRITKNINSNYFTKEGSE